MPSFPLTDSEGVADQLTQSPVDLALPALPRIRSLPTRGLSRCNSGLDLESTLRLHTGNIQRFGTRFTAENVAARKAADVEKKGKALHQLLKDPAWNLRI